MTTEETALSGRDSLESLVWELTEWRGSATTVDRLMTAIDEYASRSGPEVQNAPIELAEVFQAMDRDGVSVAVLELDGIRPTESETRRIDEVIALDIDRDGVAGEKAGLEAELVDLAWKAHRGGPGMAAFGYWRLAEISEALGDMLGWVYWATIAAREGVPVAARALQDPAREQRRREYEAEFAESERGGDQTCSACELPKPWDDFPKDKTYKTGHRRVCRVCVRDKVRAREAAKKTGTA